MQGINNPLLARLCMVGMLSVITQVPPKTDGIILIYDFSNFPTTKFWWFFVSDQTGKTKMKKWIFLSICIIVITSKPSWAALDFSCKCPDGTSVPTGEYCPGSLTPCGGGSSCLNCNSTDWGPHITGYESRTTATCLAGSCRKSVSYRCAAGYYGNFLVGATGCTQCPSQYNVTGTSEAGSTSITDCYIPAGTTFSTTSGSGKWTDISYYCE